MGFGGGPERMRFGPGFLHAAKIVTWDPNHIQGGISLSNGNLTATSSVSGGNAEVGGIATQARTVGKFYFEVHVDKVAGQQFSAIGIGISTSVTRGAESWLLQNDNGSQSSSILEHNGNDGAAGSYFSGGTTIGVAVDTTNNLLWMSINGSWQFGGNPSSGGAGVSIKSESWFPEFFIVGSGTACTANFGGSAFTYGTPSGFIPWQS